MKNKALNLRDLDLVIDLVHQRSGILLDRSKEYLIEARLSAMVSQKLGTSVADILAKLRGPRATELEHAVVNAMTTNETSFLRDQYPFDALKNVILPDLRARRANVRRLSIWCAASSSGQEPYSVVMLLREHFPEMCNWDISFVASDLSPSVLARARTGVYSQLEVSRGLPEAWLQKYFRKQGQDWEIVAEIRQMVTFKQVNLLEAWPTFPPLDLVFIRNVMIYFDQETKKTILARIRQIMQPDGYMFLGSAETTLNVDDVFERTTFDKSNCYKLKEARKAAA